VRQTGATSQACEAAEERTPGDAASVFAIDRKRLPLARSFVAGACPLLENEACALLAVHFGKSCWQQDATAFAQACHRLHWPSALERSRSGQGGHVRQFFDAALPAAMARRLGPHLVTEVMEARPDISLDSYDRVCQGERSRRRAARPQFFQNSKKKRPLVSGRF